MFRFTMAMCVFLKHLWFVLTSFLLMLSIGYATSADLTLSPDAGPDGLHVGGFAFFVCDVEGFDINTMFVAWTFNGIIFADAVLDSPLQLHSNVDAIFGFDVTNNDFSTPSSLEKDESGNELHYEAFLDILLGEWRYSGQYGCDVYTINVINGKYDNIESSSNEISLRVAYFPPTPYPYLETSSMQLGRNVALVLGVESMVSCYSYSGNPDVDFSLLKNDNSVQGIAFKDGDFTFYNYTFMPTSDDDGVIFSCSISSNVPSSTNPTPVYKMRTNSLSPLDVVSIPEVVIEGLSVIGYGDDLTLTCRATSATDTPIIYYYWTVSDLASNRYSVENENNLIIHSVVESDNGKLVSCQVTDAVGMEGSGMYNVNAMHPDDNTTAAPTVTNDPKDTSWTALIIVICIVFFLLICLCVYCFCLRNKTSSKFGSKPTTDSSTTSNKGFHERKDMNGPYTISGSGMVSNSPKSDIHHMYNNDKSYPPNGDYYQSSSPYNYKLHQPYERSSSQEPFYPADEKHPEYHYNSSYGYDDDKKPGYPPEDNNEVLIGDFTQPSDRQPAYGQGYDDYIDGYDDQRHPDDYNDLKPSNMYDDGDRGGYDITRDPVEYDRESARYDKRELDAYEGEYMHDGVDEHNDPPRSPNYNNYKDDFSPPGHSYPPSGDGYNDPNVTGHYGDEYPEDRDDMYARDEEKYQPDYEPYGERDRVPDGQEADYQGEPYIDPYSTPTDRIPVGGPPVDDDPYYGYDINVQPDNFDSSQKLNTDSLTSDRFDPSYV